MSKDKKLPIPHRWDHFRSLPFETLFGFLALISGILAFVNFGGVASDAVSVLLPSLLTKALSFFYAISGLTLLVGLWKPRRDIEAFGLVTLAASTFVRTMAILIVLGFSDIATISLVFNSLIIGACSVRLLTIVRREVVVLLRREE